MRIRTVATAGCATSRFAPGGSNAARRSRARASKAARSCASSSSDARRAGPNDLQEAKAVDRGALERLRQMLVDRRGDSLALRLAAVVGKSIPIEPPMSCRRIAWPLRPRRASASSSGGAENRRHRSASSPASGEMRSSPPAKTTIPLRACSISSYQPAALEPVAAARAGIPAAERRRVARRPRPSARASGRFHGSPPGIASRMTSMFRAAPSVTPGAPRGSRYSSPLGTATAFGRR